MKKRLITSIFTILIGLSLVQAVGAEPTYDSVYIVQAATRYLK